MKTPGDTEGDTVEPVTGSDSEKPPEHGPHKLYRCHSSNGCGNVYLHEDVTKGGCPHCGGRRVSFAVALTDKEAAWVAERGFDLEGNGWQQHESPNGD